MAIGLATAGRTAIEDLPRARFLFRNPVTAPRWLVLRGFLGSPWLTAGGHTVQDPAWMATGDGLKGFLTRAAALPAAPKQAPIAFDWYRSFLPSLLDVQASTWFAKVVACGEVLLGVALLLGRFTGVAAFFGGFLNWNVMLAGTASTTPLLFAVAVALLLAWQVAGASGLDRYLLPALGPPWQAGRLLGGAPAAGPSAPVPGRRA